MRILVTGSSGLIGTNLALSLQQFGHDVMGIDLRPNPWSSRIPTAVRDLIQPLADFTWPADIVVHLAAHAKVHETVLRPALAFENVRMGENVLELARRTGTPIVLGSSREIYGNLNKAATGERAVFIDESASPYSASKLAVEALGYAFYRSYGLPVMALRFSNVYGRFDCDLLRMERVVPLFISQISSAAPITIYGAEKVLDFTFIDDCVDGIMRAINAIVAGRIICCAINIASGRGTSLVELAELIGKIVGMNPVISLVPTRTGEISRYVADLSTAESILGYRPTTFITEGLTRSIRWQEESGYLPRR